MSTVTFRAKIERSGKTATGIEVPADAAALGSGRRPPVRATISSHVVFSAVPEPTTAVLVVAHPVAQGDAEPLCERLQSLVRDSGADVIVCDVRALYADARSVDALARLQLTARRLGRQIRLVRASPELDDLLSFLGLSSVVGCRRTQRTGCSRPPPAPLDPPEGA